jgi:hypothetical protein
VRNEIAHSQGVVSKDGPKYERLSKALRGVPGLTFANSEYIDELERGEVRININSEFVLHSILMMHKVLISIADCPYRGKTMTWHWIVRNFAKGSTI